MALSYAPHRLPTSDDLAGLRNIVRRRASSRMNEFDVEDLAADFMVSAVVTASRPGKTAPIAVMARAYAAKSADRYKRASQAATTTQKTLAVETEASGFSRAALNVEAAQDQYLGGAVRHVLAALPRECARVLWMCDAEGATLKEAAIALNMPIATTHRRLAEARAAFRKVWTAE